MIFDVEVLLKGTEAVVTETIRNEMREPRTWTDSEVHEILRLMLLQFDLVQYPGSKERAVSLLGLSWIVTPLKNGVAIAIEIPSGTVVAGPFEIEADWLTAAISRVLAKPHSSTTQPLN